MYTFTNDYNQTAHPKLMEEFLNTQNKILSGYGNDELCALAKKLMKQKLQNEEVDIHFFSSGTITNLTTISHILRPYEAVISADSGHIFVHETGAIEATGHKVFPVESKDGKLNIKVIKEVLASHIDFHMVKPKMIYISQTSEYGSIYNKKELEQLYSFCKKNNLYLYIDGARLASALAASDIQMQDLVKLCDAFYIGATKAGAFIGEALVIVNDDLKCNFKFSMKQKGAIMAKSWVIASQFIGLFKDNLYYELGEKMNALAKELSSCFEGFCFFLPPQSNQIFVILPKILAKELLKIYALVNWKYNEENLVLRFCTSFCTTKEDIQKFKDNFSKIKN